MSSVPAPPLSGWVRGLRWLSVVLVVALAAVLASVAYSAAQIRPTVQAPNENSASIDSNGTVEANASVSVANPGYFSFSNAGLDVDVFLPSGQLLAHATSPHVTIRAGSMGVIPISLDVPLSAIEASPELLTNDTVLHTYAWFNATYAEVFPISVSEAGNLTWGAPFADLSVVPLTPVPQGNGSVAVSIAIAFDNHASFADAGVLAFQVKGSGGGMCASGLVPLDVQAGGSFQQTLGTYVPPSCLAGGASVELSFTTAGYTLPLGSEALP